MSAGLTQVQANCFNYVKGCLDATGVPPSYEEIKAHIGLNNRGRVVKIVSALVERGVLRHLPHKARSLAICADAPTSFVIDPLPEIRRAIELYAMQEKISVQTAVNEALGSYFLGPWTR